MTCKGICIRHKAMTNHYSNGQRRCQVCELFIKWDGLFCPCCGYRLRTRPRNAKYKRRLTLDRSRSSLVIPSVSTREGGG
ncbi:MAG TPA: hypothetical protein VE619_09415 [Nitrososphaeraceae archaeon]|nr:hypothetical protein [Nitrososphaeraceae archaeon]